MQGTPHARPPDIQDGVPSPDPGQIFRIAEAHLAQGACGVSIPLHLKGKRRRRKKRTDDVMIGVPTLCRIMVRQSVVARLSSGPPKVVASLLTCWKPFGEQPLDPCGIQAAPCMIDVRVDPLMDWWVNVLRRKGTSYYSPL